MASLLDKTNQILDEKNSKLLPENIKENVTILGVTGTLTPGSTTSGVKLFETIDEMKADPNPQEGDLAVVYRSEVQNATVDSQFQVATFPETVVLDTAITDYVEVRYRAVDSSKMFDCWGNLDSSRFSMDCYTDSGSIRIEYTSSDGITYTRTDNTGNPVDFGTEIYYEMAEYWNDAIGKFIQVGGMTFEGLYTCDTNVYLNNICTNIPLSDEITTEFYKIPDCITELNTSGIIIPTNTTTENDIKIITSGIAYMTFFRGIGLVKQPSRNIICFALFNSDKTNTPERHVCSKIEFDTTLENPIVSRTDYSVTDISNSSYMFDVKSTVDWYGLEILNGNNTVYCSRFTVNTAYPTYTYDTDVDKPEATKITEVYTTKEHYKSFEYKIAPTQLSAISDYVYEKEFYGQNGVEIGTLGTPDNSFADTNAELVYKIQNTYNDMEPRVLTDDDKTIDKNIYFIPVKTDGTPLLDTSNVTNMTEMFNGCTNLTTIPKLDTNSATIMNAMFYNCTNLTTMSLLDTSSVTNMGSIFYGCTNLSEIPLLDTSSVTNMYAMFNGCYSLATIPELNTSNVTTMQYMFIGCENLTTIPLLDTSKVTNMAYMFNGCYSLATIPELNTSNVTDMQYMFNYCRNLTNIPLLDTSKVTNMQYMFSNCENLTEIPLLDTGNATNMYYMFNNCKNLTTIPLLDTDSVIDMRYMFQLCTNLTTIPLLNASKVTNMQYMFNNCESLTDESLNNILAMCKNATLYTSTKTLAFIGLTSAQATRCQSLSNYSSFTSAGWTTGY